MITMDSGEHIFLAESLKVPARKLAMSFRVSRKGCGRGSGEAPRALKLILLNRLLAANPSCTIRHEGGDSYRITGAGRDCAFTFRISTAKRLSETGRPWFNVSARELENWKLVNRQLIIAECKSSGESLVARAYVIPPTAFEDISRYATKLSEVVPSALFEVQQDEAGFYLYNLTAKEAYPKVRIPSDATVELALTPSEQDLLKIAYEDMRERDRTVGGDFEPLVVTVDPGRAPPEEIAAYLAEISHFYHLLGGSGVQFVMVDSREPARVLAQ